MDYCSTLAPHLHLYTIHDKQEIKRIPKNVGTTYKRREKCKMSLSLPLPACLSLLFCHGPQRRFFFSRFDATCLFGLVLQKDKQQQQQANLWSVDSSVSTNEQCRRIFSRFDNPNVGPTTTTTTTTHPSLLTTTTNECLPACQTNQPSFGCSGDGFANK